MKTVTRCAGMVAAAAGAAGLIGCSASTNWPPKYHATRAMVIPAPGPEVSIGGESPFGDLDIAAHEHPAPHLKDAEGELPVVAPGQVALLAVVRSDREDRANDATLNPTWRGDTLVLRVEWPDGKRRRNEGADWVVRVPAVGSVSGTYDFGDVTVIDPRGIVDFNADFGDVLVVQPLGPVDIDADFGDVSIEHAHGPVAIASDFGDVRVSLTDTNPGPVDIDADFGDVNLDAGPAFTGHLAMDTDFGASRFTQLGADRRTMKSSGSLATTLGEGPQSSITADFGDVTVTVRE